MSGTPAVTVLIPTHNRADVLPFAIRSVLAQTLADFELFVVGDGCTDGTAGVVAAFDDPRIRWFDLPKAPYFGYANRNKALREGRGELVAYLGHDDLWLPDHLEVLSAALEREHVEFAHSRQVLISSDGTVRQHLVALDDPTMLERLMRGREGVGPSCVVHRRECLERYGYWREDLPRSADWELWTRILRGSGGRLAYCHEPTSLHFVAEWRSETWRRRLFNGLRRWDGSLPSELSVAVPSGRSEQEAVWQALSADPAGWTANLRRGLRIDLDRIARMEHLSSFALLADGQRRRLAGR